MLGIEPAVNVAQVAIEMGIPTRTEFFGVDAWRRASSPRASKADLIVGNNVLAQVPDLNDFVAGMKLLLKPEGVVTLEFPHLERLIAENQFDTIYHEHFSYFSLITIETMAAAARAEALRRGGTADPRRLAARVPGACRKRAPDRFARRKPARQGEGGAVSTRSRAIPASPSGRAGSSATSCRS